jgi:hypothetical protein
MRQRHFSAVVPMRAKMLVAKPTFAPVWNVSRVS